RQAGHRRARRVPPRSLERGPPRRRDRARPRPQGRALRALEEPREPDRPPAAQARPHPTHQPAPISRLPPQRATAPDLPRRPRRGDRRPQRVAEMGEAMSPRAVRQARPHDPRPASRDRGRAAPPTLKRPDRADQHPDPADHPPRLRLPLTLGHHRPGDAVTRRPVPTPPRPLTQPTVPSGGSFFREFQESPKSPS